MYQYPICKGSNEDSLQGGARASEGVKRRGIRGMIILLPDSLLPTYPYPPLMQMVAAIPRPYPLPSFLSTQSAPRTDTERSELDIGSLLPSPSLAARSLLLPSYSPTALCHCRFCACWENASHKYHLARRPPANVASNQRRLELHTRAPLAAIDFSPSPPTAPQGDGAAAERMSSRARRRNAQSIYLTELGATPSLIMCWRGCQSVGR